MALWKVVLVDLAMVGIVVGAFAVILGRWLEHREQMMTWPSVTATIVRHEQGPGFKGRSATYLLGHYGSGADAHEFKVIWGASEFGTTADGKRTWVPPCGTPAPGTNLPVHVNPARPEQVELESAPSVPSTLHTFTWLSVVVAIALMTAISVWFV